MYATPCQSRDRDPPTVTVADTRTSPSTDEPHRELVVARRRRAARRWRGRPRRRARARRGTRSRARPATRPGRRAHELVLDRFERPRVVHVVEHVEVARRAAATVATPRPAGGASCTQTTAHPPAAGRLAVDGRGSRRRAASGRPALAVDEDPQADGLDERAAIAGGHASCGARPSTARCRCRTSPARPRRGTRAARRSRGRSSATTQTPSRSDEPGVVGVVGGDVLEEAGQRLEPQLAPLASTSPRCTRRAPRNTRPRAGHVHELDRHRLLGRTALHGAVRVSSAATGCAETLRASVPAWRRTEGATVSGLLDRLGRRAVRHHWWFIGVWVVAAVAIVVLAGAPRRPDQRQLPHPRHASRRRRSTCSRRTSPAAAGDSATVVFQTPDGIDDPSVEPAISASVADAREDPARHVGDRSRTVRSARAFISKSGKIARRHRAVRHARRRDLRQGRLRPDRQQRPRRRRRPASSSRTAARSSTTPTNRRRATPTSSACSPRS